MKGQNPLYQECKCGLISNYQLCRLKKHMMKAGDERVSLDVFNCQLNMIKILKKKEKCLENKVQKKTDENTLNLVKDIYKHKV